MIYIIMASKYICDKCGLCTDRKSDFLDHQNKKFMCSPEKIHARTKKVVNINDIPIKMETPAEDEFVCLVCNKKLTTKFNLDRHMKSLEHKKNMEIHGNDNIMIKGDIKGDHNNVKNIIHKENFNIHLQCAKETHKYTYYNIDDLTLLEQYMALTNTVFPENTPYDILTNLTNFNPNKPKYDNIKSINTNKNEMNVYDGERIINSSGDHVSFMIINQRLVLCEIYNKFRMFLSRKANIRNIKHLFNGLEISKKHKKLIKDMKRHIRNKLNETKKDISIEGNKQIWVSISKSFNWDDVVKYIKEMEEIRIDFNDNLGDIRESLQVYSKKNKSKSFDKLLIRLQKLIYDHEKELPTYSSSESNEIDKFENGGKEEIDQEVEEAKKRDKKFKDLLPGRHEQRTLQDKWDKEKIKLDDHKRMTSKIIFEGAEMIGKQYLIQRHKSSTKA